MSQPNDPLSIQLQQAEPHIADGGFTDAILARIALTASARKLRPLPMLSPRARLLAFGMTSVGSVIAALGLREANLVDSVAIAPLLSLTTVPPNQWGILLAIGWLGALAISGIALLKLR